MKPIIKVSDVSKKYRIQTQANSYETLRDALTRMARAPLRNLRQRWNGAGETIWALKDVNFEVTPGEVIGIVGRNGAGKSTLLKILSRITEPSSGKVELYGRVGSLLEVGTGFHPELTGRENLFLNGAILGMNRSEIVRKLDEIVAFAEIEKFLDTPVKFYSSGMYMRLAFSVAAHLEPEILLVDEVLAVGDAAFQKKCLGKMGEVAKAGRTVLFVSHNIPAVRSLCTHGLWLHGGRIAAAGDADRVIDQYLKNVTAMTEERIWEDAASAPGDHQVRLRHAIIKPVGESDSELMTVRSPLLIDLAFWNELPDASLNFSVVLYRVGGIAVFNTGSGAKVFARGLVRGSFVIPGDFLNNGRYSMRVLIVKDGATVLLDVYDLLEFEIHDVERAGNWYGEWVGVVRPKFDWDLRAEQAEANN